MTDAISIAGGLGAGLLLGAFFFVGLWWTVHRGVSSPQAALIFAASYLVRVAVLGGGLYILGNGNPTRGVAACVGVLLARIAVARFRPATSARNVAGGTAS